MTVTVRLVGVFRINRFKEQQLSLSEGCTVATVIDQLELSRRLLGIILINGRHGGEEDCLHDGDSLSLMPLLEGG